MYIPKAVTFEGGMPRIITQKEKEDLVKKWTKNIEDWKKKVLGGK